MITHNHSLRILPHPHARPAHVPRILFFGGDIVSVSALEALHARMQRVLQAHFRTALHDATPEQLTQRVQHQLREQLTVICPALPRGVSPAQAAKKYRRQYPVARFCVEKDIPVFAVDDPRSFAKSALLEEMLQCQPPPTMKTKPVDTVQGPCKNNGEEEKGGGASAASASAVPRWTDLGRSLRDYDVTVVVSFRYFLPKRLLHALPPVINVHPSLLPHYRGASPIFSTLLRNETCGGVSVIQMTAEQPGMDAGAVLWQGRVPIPPDMDVRAYFPKVTQLGAQGLCEVLFGPEGATSTTEKTALPTTAAVAATGPNGHGTTPRNGERYAEKAAPCPAPNGATSSRCAPVVPPRRLNGKSSFPATGGAAPLVEAAEACSDWPKSFTNRWRRATPQDYPSFDHFTQDPFHAPLLPKDVAVLCFSRHTALEAYGTWRAFAGGDYFHPSVNATLDKRSTPVRNQLTRRAVRRLLRQREALHRSAQTGRGVDRSRVARMTVSELAAAVDDRLILSAEEGLRLSCTFLRAVHPDLVPAAVKEELTELENGSGRVVFYRAPPPAFPLSHEQHGDWMAAASRAAAEAMNATSDDGDDFSVEAEEEAVPAEYVPYVILAAPPCSHSPSSSFSSSTASCAGGGGGGSEKGGEAEGGAKVPLVHIPPGTGYFPRAMEDMGAIKCHEGWFFWQEAHLKLSSRPQPVGLLRKGLAMKTGMLYPGLFSEYS